MSQKKTRDLEKSLLLVIKMARYLGCNRLPMAIVGEVMFAHAGICDKTLPEFKDLQKIYDDVAGC